jgi:hypothetical protein
MESSLEHPRSSVRPPGMKQTSTASEFVGDEWSSRTTFAEDRAIDEVLPLVVLVVIHREVHI